MKSILQKLIGSIAVVLMTAVSVYAQVPQGFNFQAIARGANGEILADQALGVKVSVIKGTEEGNPLYEETHTVTTNPLGLIQIVIGEGTAGEGQTFSAIDFGNDNYYVKLAIDPAGGTEYADLGTTRLLSVPYALVAQKAIEGGSGAGGVITNYILDVAQGDTAFQVTISGDEGAVNNSAIIGLSNTKGVNVGVEGKAHSANGSTSFQVGTYGEAIGESIARHYGLYGYASSKGIENIGSFAISLGDGNGNIVLPGDEVEGEGIGSVNAGMVGLATGNLNTNVGARGFVYGDQGARVNIGVTGEARATSSGTNIGMESFSSGSQNENWAFQGTADGSNARNLGMRLNVFNGTSNIGLEVNADTAAILNGASIINGDLTVTGTLNYSGNLGSGGAITEYNLDTAVDTSFIINATGSKAISGALKVRSSTDGQNRGVDSRITTSSGNEASQLSVYGRAEGEGSGSHYGTYGIALGNGGGSNYGTYGYAQGIGKFNFGIQAVALGSGSGEIVPVGDEVNGNAGSFNIGGGFYPSGNSNGNVGVDVEVGGSAGERVNLGSEFRVSTTSSGLNSGVQTIVNGSSTLNRGFWGLVNGDNNNVGMELSVNGGTSNIGLIVNAETAAQLNGNTTITGNLVVNGNIEHTGSITQTSDRNLKENIQPLENGVSTIMKLRPTSYNFRGDGEYKGLKLSRGLHYGLIAQEVEEVLPSLVKDNKHTYLAPAEGAGPNNSEEKTEVKNMNYKTMNYTELIPVLIKAVQEQQEEIEKLRKQIESLKKDK